MSKIESVFKVVERVIELILASIVLYFAFVAQYDAATFYLLASVLYKKL